MRRNLWSLLAAFSLLLFLFTACGGVAGTPAPEPDLATEIPETPVNHPEVVESEAPIQTGEPAVEVEATSVPDPLNKLFDLRSVKISLVGSRSGKGNRSIIAELDQAGNMHLYYSLPAVQFMELPEGLSLPEGDIQYEVYVIDGSAYVPSEEDPTWKTTPVSTDYFEVLLSQMHGLEGFTLWLDMLPAGSLQEASSEETGGFNTDKYAVSGTVGGQLITGALWYDQSSRALVKAELHVPASLDSDPAVPEIGEILITLNTEKAEIPSVTLPAN